ncbi:MAG: HPr kinase/phosphorylase [Brevundimonas sp.]|uniref:HPr kinase/phosphorylase n=1 Tax=Brevundimonas sp. TaxID=1871086 RepID=UPI00391AFD83
MNPGPPPLHASVAAAWTPQGWAGVMIEGPPGAGKSALTLRLLERGFRLVADDYALIWTSGGRLYARAPARIAGRLEGRGVGLLEVPPLALVPLALAIQAEAAPERLPEPRSRVIDGVTIPQLGLPLDDPLAAVLIARVLRRLPCDPVLP